MIKKHLLNKHINRLNLSILTVLISFLGVGKVLSQEGFGRPEVYANNSANAAVAVVRTVEVVKLGPPTLAIVRNANCATTVTFDGRLQTADGVNAAGQVINFESPAVFPAEKATGFFRTVR